MKISKTSIRTGTAVATAVLLAGCVATRLPPDRRGVSFPVRADSYLREGIVVAPEAVRGIRVGMNKPEVRRQLGNPHFTEGLFAVHDWNYVFKLSVPPGGMQECQFQVQFDAHQRVTATYWQTAACEAAASIVPSPGASEASGAEAKAKAEAEAGTSIAAPARTADWSLSDLRFAFGRSDLAGLRDEDRQRLYVFAAQIGGRADTVRRVQVVGYADRIGSRERIYRRALARAEAVAEVFVASGVDPALMVIAAKGDAESVTACAPQPRPALIACLAPDRQVTVEVQTIRK